MNKKEDSLYFGVPLYSLIPDKSIPFKLFRKDNQQRVLVVEKNDKFPKKLSSLINNLYVRYEDKQSYYNYIESMISDISKNENISLSDKSKLIYDTSSSIVNDLFEKPESKETMQRTKTLVNSTIDVILSDDKSIKSMMAIGSHDYYTYTHSVDVAVFSIGFANYLKYSFEEISRIGYGAMMHDIGKSKIPSEIINKKGKLSEAEFEIMKKHPVYSYEILQFHGEVDKDILTPARNHHEKARGDGYPDGLTTAQMHPFAKIVAIVDIFSALTTKRSYKNAFSSFEALDLMKEKMLNDIDKNLFKEFIKFMGKSSQ